MLKAYIRALLTQEQVSSGATFCDCSSLHTTIDHMISFCKKNKVVSTVHSLGANNEYQGVKHMADIPFFNIRTRDHIILSTKKVVFTFWRHLMPPAPDLVSGGRVAAEQLVLLR